jgi:hypothetical protein
LVTFGWLQAIALLLLRPWVWIPAQCTSSTSSAASCASARTLKRWHDNTRTHGGSPLPTFIHRAIYSRHVLTDLVFCSPKGEMEGGCKSIVADGQRNTAHRCMYMLHGKARE